MTEINITRTIINGFQIVLDRFVSSIDFTLIDTDINQTSIHLHQECINSLFITLNVLVPTHDHFQTTPDCLLRIINIALTTHKTIVSGTNKQVASNNVLPAFTIFWLFNKTACRLYLLLCVITKTGAPFCRDNHSTESYRQATRQKQEDQQSKSKKNVDPAAT